MKVVIILLAILSQEINSELVQVISISRHGSRTDYESDEINKDQEYKFDKNLPKGTITPVGLRQMFNLGRYLRK